MYSYLQDLYNEHPHASILAATGGLVLLSNLPKYLSTLYTYLKSSKRRNLKQIYGGEFAVITGASFGLGKEYSKELARQGYNLVIIARKQDDLDSLAREIHEERGGKLPKLQIIIQPFDFSVDYSKSWSVLEENISNLDVGILINNVGILSSDHYESMDISKIKGILNVNIYSHVFMTRLLLPKMLETNSKTGSKSAIVNICSIYDNGLWGYRMLYCATKAFLRIFSKGLSIEYEGIIDVLNVRPGGVTTRMNPKSGFYYLVHPGVAARTHLRFVGNAREAVCCWRHILQDVQHNHVKSQDWRNGKGRAAIANQVQKDQMELQRSKGYI